MSQENQYQIAVPADAAPPIRLARQELLRALTLLQAPPVSIQLAAFQEELDGFTVDVNFPAGSGFIRGSNPRSVLYGVYRLLRGLGFAWLRPGAAGEVIPPPPAQWSYLRYWEQAATPLRCVCIEGADSRENLLEMVEWMARHYFNAYYLQAESAYAFLERYYRHTGNPLTPPEEFSREDGARVTAEVLQALRERGMALHQFGHGPTGEILGLSHWGWDPQREPVTPEMKQHFAEINGRRELWHQTPKYTQLCYGDPDIRERLARRAVEQAAAHPDAEVVHFFLSDHHHNFCECPLCRGRRPADWYADILNRIDELLIEQGLPTRIGFAVYYDLFWPPVAARLRNPGRFLLVACPVSRSYDRPLGADGSADHIPPFLLNISPFPQGNRQLMAFFDAWKRQYPGDCTIFDYHYMWELHRDYGGEGLARVIHADAAALAAQGFTGFISCQNQRAFYPNALGMTALAAGLWGGENSDFEAVAEQFYSDAYGSGWPAAREYLQAVSRLLPPRLVRGEGTAAQRRAAAEALTDAAVEAAIATAAPAMSAGLAAPCAAVRRSWEMLQLHTAQFRLAARAFALLWTQGTAAAGPAVARLLDWARVHESALQESFDLYEYLNVTITVTGVDRTAYLNRTGEADLGEI